MANRRILILDRGLGTDVQCHLGPFSSAEGRLPCGRPAAIHEQIRSQRQGPSGLVGRQRGWLIGLTASSSRQTWTSNGTRRSTSPRSPRRSWHRSSTASSDSPSQRPLQRSDADGPGAPTSRQLRRPAELSRPGASCACRPTDSSLAKPLEPFDVRGIHVEPIHARPWQQATFTVLTREPDFARRYAELRIRA